MSVAYRQLAMTGRQWPLVVATLFPRLLLAQAGYDQHVLFDNSLTPARYFYSSVQTSEPSSLDLDRGRVPVDTTVFVTPPNALRLAWRSAAGGYWEATLRPSRWRNRDPVFQGDTLSIWCYSKDSLPAAHFPRLRLQDLRGVLSAPLALEGHVRDLAGGRWIRLRIPLHLFESPAGARLDPRAILALTFLQGAPDGAPHALMIDEIRVDGGPGGGASGGGAPAPPTAPRATGAARHVDLTWDPPKDERAERYIIYRSLDSVSYRPVGIQRGTIHRYADFLGRQGIRAWYKVTASDREYRESAFSERATATTRRLNEGELLTMVQEASLRYYWEGAHPVAGMALENIPGDDRIVATGASGFGIMAIIAGVHRGLIARDEAARRVHTIVEFLAKADRFHGAWPHFLDGRTGRVVPLFGEADNGGDLVETAFLVQGLLAARQYFTGSDPTERGVIRRITELWESVEWDWYRRSAESDFLYWHWSPDYGWALGHKLIGFNETLITYLLAIASPTHAVPPGLYYSGWASRSDEAAVYRRAWGGTVEGEHYTNGNSYFGTRLEVGVGRGGPLFFTHYSYLGLDPRALRDRYTNHFENNQAIARINRAYVAANPGGFAGYARGAWGSRPATGPGDTAHEPREGLDDSEHHTDRRARLVSLHPGGARGPRCIACTTSWAARSGASTDSETRTTRPRTGWRRSTWV